MKIKQSLPLTIGFIRHGHSGRFLSFLCLLILSLCEIAYSQPSFINVKVSHNDLRSVNYELHLIAKGFDIPWGIAFIEPFQVLVSERSGGLYLLNLKDNLILPISHSLSLYTQGQGGLLDIAIEPNSQWIYFTYSSPSKAGPQTALARAQRNDNTLEQWETVLTTRSSSDTTQHFGSRIAFDGAGHVFISIGDRGVRENSQKLNTHAGKILRVNLNGQVPQDNPFIDNPKALPQIWSYGHRNPQGLFFDKEKKRLWSIEHGPRGGDEINLILPGKNYGWPIVSHGKEYWAPIAVGEATSKKGMVDPVKVYTPSIAPSSLIVYSGKVFKNWQGRLISGALKLQHLNIVTLNEQLEAISEIRLFEFLKQRIRAVAEAPNGWIYFSTDQGNLYAIKPLNENLP